VPEAFLQLPAADQAEILQTCAGKLDRRPEHLEKDVWICWVLQGLFAMPGRLPMAFKGGTSLSKVHEAIRRFSEDVDVTVDYKSLVSDLLYPQATVQVLAPSRTFWEKATLIHVACNRSDPKLDSDRQSRHWHDLAVLADHQIGNASYEACLSGSLRLIPDAPLLKALRTDYEKMIADGMFDGESPTFDSIVARLGELAKEINAR
jgi:Nucleotidyl transferase AbiEii toxin, Type IV TA system